MAYRRRHGVSRSSTFKEEINSNGQELLLDNNNSDDNNNNNNNNIIAANAPPPSLLTSNNSSLAAQAIKASAARYDPSLSFAFSKSSLGPENDHHHRSKSFDSYGDASKSGIWSVLAQKAKEILEDDDNSSTQTPRSHSFNTTIIPGARNQELAAGRTVVESRLKGSCENDDHANHHETQLKASRDVAMATAAKAKLLLRELKTVKADLAFAKSRCAQLEEENKLLRDKEGREKGLNRADDDLIRLQLETLLTEKARLASENEVYSRENRFLREFVEYHQLTMQDVVYFDEDMEEEEVTELYVSQLPSRSMHTKSIFTTVPQQQQQHQASPTPSASMTIPPSISKDQHAK